MRSRGSGRIEQHPNASPVSRLRARRTTPWLGLILCAHAEAPRRHTATGDLEPSDLSDLGSRTEPPDRHRRRPAGPGRPARQPLCPPYRPRLSEPAAHFGRAHRPAPPTTKPLSPLARDLTPSRRRRAASAIGRESCRARRPIAPKQWAANQRRPGSGRPCDSSRREFELAAERMIYIMWPCLSLQTRLWGSESFD